MGEKRKVEEELPGGAPLYMVSFGDMMTIMLTFFILLCSYSKERQAGFISDGVGSFKNVINSMGLPGVLPGDKYPIDLGASRARYKPVGALNDQYLTDAEGRVSDLNRDALRQVVKKALAKNRVSRLPVTLLYDRRATAVTKDHQELLNIVAPMLSGKNLTMRFEGYANEEGVGPIETQEIAVSRALSAARYVSENFGIPIENMRATGYASGGGIGADRSDQRFVQDRYGRRIVLVYLVPEEN